MFGGSTAVGRASVPVAGSSTPSASAPDARLLRPPPPGPPPPLPPPPASRLAVALPARSRRPGDRSSDGPAAGDRLRRDGGGDPGGSDSGTNPGKGDAGGGEPTAHRSPGEPKTPVAPAAARRIRPREWRPRRARPGTVRTPSDPTAVGDDRGRRAQLHQAAGHGPAARCPPSDGDGSADRDRAGDRKLAEVRRVVPRRPRRVMRESRRGDTSDRHPSAGGAPNQPRPPALVDRRHRAPRRRRPG